MTADGRTDEALYEAANAGDREAANELKSRFLLDLYDFALRIALDPTVAETATLSALDRLTSGAGRDERVSLRAAILAGLRDDALETLRGRGEGNGERSSGLSPVDPMFSASPGDTDPELAAWAWQAARSQRPRDYSLLDMSVRRGVAADELAEATDMSHSGIYAILGRLRGSFEETFTSTLLFHRGRQACPEVAAIIQGQATLGPALRREIARHVEGCSSCRQTRRQFPSPADLLQNFLPVAPSRGLAASAGVVPLAAEEGAGALDPGLQASLPLGGAAALGAAGLAAAEAAGALMSGEAPEAELTPDEPLATLEDAAPDASVEEAAESLDGLEAADLTSVDEEPPVAPSSIEEDLTPPEDELEEAPLDEATPAETAVVDDDATSEVEAGEPPPDETLSAPRIAPAAAAWATLATSGAANDIETDGARDVQDEGAESVEEDGEAEATGAPDEIESGREGAAVMAASSTLDDASDESETAEDEDFYDDDDTTREDDEAIAEADEDYAEDESSDEPDADETAEAAAVGGAIGRGVGDGDSRIRFEGARAAGPFGPSGGPPRGPFDKIREWLDEQGPARISLGVLFVGALLLAVYLGLALGDSIEGGDGGGGSANVLPTTTPGVGQIGCGSGPHNIDQGSINTLTFDARALAGYQMTSAVGVRAVSANAAAQAIQATARPPFALEVTAQPLPGPAGRLDEYRITVTFTRSGQQNITSECIVLVRAPAVAATTAAPASATPGVTSTATPTVRPATAVPASSTPVPPTPVPPSSTVAPPTGTSTPTATVTVTVTRTPTPTP